MNAELLNRTDSSHGDFSATIDNITPSGGVGGALQTHDVYYKNFLAQFLGPATVGAYSYFVGVIGIITVIAIMIACLSHVSMKKELDNNRRLCAAAASGKSLKKRSTPRVIIEPSSRLARATGGGATANGV